MSVLDMKIVERDVSAVPVSAYAPATRCSVLTRRICLCACYVMLSTDNTYLPMRLLRDAQY
eukprot:2374426-Rhodomonas_salina.2